MVLNYARGTHTPTHARTHAIPECSARQVPNIRSDYFSLYSMYYDFIRFINRCSMKLFLFVQNDKILKSERKSCIIG